jgi:hypothetical protein
MCFSLGWIEQLFVWFIVICAVVAILKILLPFVAGQLGAAGGVIIQVINIVLWAIIAICVVYFCFAVISCLNPSKYAFFALFAPDPLPFWGFTCASSKIVL